MPIVEKGLPLAVLLLATALAVSSLSFSDGPVTGRQRQISQATTPGPQYLPGEVIIKWKSSAGVQLSKITAGALTTGITPVDKVLQRYKGEGLSPIFPHHRKPQNPKAIDLTCFYSFRYGDGTDPTKVARALQSAGAVEYAEPRYLRRVFHIPNDPDFGRQWYLRKIQADRAWDVTRGDSTIIIGIVDTGVDWQHPDLAANIWRNNKEIPNNGVDDDGNGYIDDIRGWDFGGQSGTPDNNPDEDRSDHGTILAGLASAVTDNSVGIAGIGYRCKIMAVKTSRDDRRDDGGSPFIVYGYEGMVYAVDNGASIINASWGSFGYSQFEQEMINYVTGKGALVVTAAGNGGTSEPIYPAGYQHALAVAATDSLDRRSVWGLFESSNYGVHVGVSAPGTAIYGTWRPQSYITLSGTSMSTPIVSGTAALVKTVHQSWTPDQIAQQLRVTADPIDNLNDPSVAQLLGYGRVNVFRAVSDSSLPGLRMVSFTLFDSIGGNNDRSIDGGEEIRLVGEFRNFLRPTTNATARLVSSDPFITITNANITVGALGTLQTVTNSSTPFIFQVSPSAPENHKATLFVNFSDGAYRDFTGFQLTLNATYKDHNVNNITMTVTSKGTFAFNDFPDNRQGSGFVFHPSGGENLLFEGAFMAATDASHVVDAARNETEFQSNDFASEKRFGFSPSPTFSNQEGLSIFTDANGTTNQVGLRIRLNTFAFRDAPNNDFILLMYTVINRRSTPISNLRVGLFFDWDVPESTPYENIVSYDETRQLGYVYDAAIGGSQAFVGTAVLTPGTPLFRAINNDHQAPGNPWGLYDGYTKQEKWESLSTGTSRNRDGPGDVSFVIGTGPFSIAGNDSVVVGFAVVAGRDLQGLQRNVELAQAKFQNIPKVTPETIVSSFTAEAKRQTVLLRWQTRQEINLDRFEVERRSIEQNGFQTISAVKSANTTGIPGSYSYSHEDTLAKSGTYVYRLRLVDLNGSSRFSEEITTFFRFMPADFVLYQNYPNPFNPGTTVRYDLPVDGYVVLAIYNVLGQKVAQLVNGFQPSGRYEVFIKGSDLPSGAYFYRLQAGPYVQVKTMTILR